MDALYLTSTLRAPLYDILECNKQHITFIKIWRGVRVAEGARLESVYTVKRIEGSNPSLSAICLTNQDVLLRLLSTPPSLQVRT